MIIARRCQVPCKLSQKVRIMTMTVSSTTVLNFDWNEAFSPENKARTIEFAKTDREHSGYTYPKEDSNFREAAVLIPLCYDIKGRPSLLYNLRSHNLSRHSGEICFPGGTLDPEDNNDSVATALRETEEELGIPRDQVEVWTLLRNFPTISTQMGVTPVLGFVIGGPVDPTKLKINPDEVDQAFTVTLEHLCSAKNWEESKGQGRYNFAMPIYKNLSVFHDSEAVNLWGLTAFLTHITLMALLPQSYKREIAFLQPAHKSGNGNSSKSKI